MHYLKSWLFRTGLIVTIAGVVAFSIFQPVVTRWSSSGSGVGEVGFSVEYADVHELPVLLTVGGLLIMAVAVIATRRKGKQTD